MLKSMIVAAVVVSGVSLAAAPASAFHCPADMAKIDAAMSKNPSLPKSTLDRIKELRALGEKQHKSGNHGASVATLAEAMKMLGVK